MKYSFKCKTRTKTYFADVFADSEIEALQALKETVPNAQNILIRDKSGWRKPKDRFFNVRWFYLGYALLLAVLGYIVLN